MKRSMFNHFIPIEGRENALLAFNAATCGLGELDKALYTYIECVDTSGVDAIPTELRQQFIQGRFLVPTDLDEARWMWARHMMMRFGSRALNLTIVPTLACNLNCSYCYQGEKRSVSMSSEVIEALVDFVSKRAEHATGLSIGWYGGEPLLELGAIERLTRQLVPLTPVNQNYRASMITNGYDLDKTTTKRLMSLGINSLQITLDGPADVHDERRPHVAGGPTYDTIVSNVITAARLGFGRISIRVNVDKQNADTIPLLLDDLARRGLNRQPNVVITFARVVPFTSGCAPTCLASLSFARTEVRLYREALQRGFQLMRYPRINQIACAAASPSAFAICPEGDVHKCWNTIQDPGRQVQHLLKLDTDLSPEHTKWLSYHPGDNEECHGCSILPMCMGGCPFRRLYPEETVHDPANACPSWKYNLADSLRLFYDAERMGLAVSPRPAGGEPTGSANKSGQVETNQLRRELTGSDGNSARTTEASASESST